MSHSFPELVRISLSSLPFSRVDRELVLPFSGGTEGMDSFVPLTSCISPLVLSPECLFRSLDCENEHILSHLFRSGSYPLSAPCVTNSLL